jgi:hypothetical protein
VWPLFHPQDFVRVRATGRTGHVNNIFPDDCDDEWLFEIVFDCGDVGHYGPDALELVAASRQPREPEIEVALETSSEDAAAIVAELERLAAEAFPLRSLAHTISDGWVFIELRPRNHPRPALRALMKRLGSSWLVEDDGWYANVTWSDERFPIDGVAGARLFLRPWRDPRPGQRLQGQLASYFPLK